MRSICSGATACGVRAQGQEEGRRKAVGKDTGKVREDAWNLGLQSWLRLPVRGAAAYWYSGSDLTAPPFPSRLLIDDAPQITRKLTLGGAPDYGAWTWGSKFHVFLPRVPTATATA